MSRVLLVDDEPAILAAVGPLLRSRGYLLSMATTGSAAIDAVNREAIDLIVLDLGLPDLDGIEVCRRLREGRSTPIIVLSARQGEGDKVAALDAGADDYVTKPFGAEELLARVRAGLRRGDGAFAATGEIVRGDLTIDIDKHRVVRAGEEIRLTPKEFELLVFFCQRPDRVLTHRVILKSVWKGQVAEQAHLRVLMASLRRKIEPDPARPRYLLTEPWIGYRFNSATSGSIT